MAYYQVTLNQGRTDTITIEAKSLTDVKKFFNSISTANITMIKKITQKEARKGVYKAFTINGALGRRKRNANKTTTATKPRESGLSNLLQKKEAPLDPGQQSTWII